MVSSPTAMVSGVLKGFSGQRRGVRAWRAIGAAAIAAGLTGAPAAAQTTVTTVVGESETIAVAIDRSSGAVYFATDRPGAIYRLTGSSATRIAGTAGGSTLDGVPALQAAVFPGRNGLAVDERGNIFVSEPSTHRIRRIDASNGEIDTIAGSPFSRPDPQYIDGSDALDTYLPAPGALAFQPGTGDLFVADEEWDIVYRITTDGEGVIDGRPTAVVRAVGGNPVNPSIFVLGHWYNPYGYAGDNGPAVDAKLNHPRGLAFDGLGNLYIADTGNNVIRRVSVSNIVTTVAGNGTPGFLGDGGPAVSGQLFMPTGVAIDAVGNLVIADTSNHRVRLVSTGAGQLTTVAGTGAAGHGGDGGPAAAASLAYPTGVVVDGSGNVLVVDSQNARLRLVSLAQTVTTLAQIGQDYVGTGLPGGVSVSQPRYLVVDRAGNMFFSDSGNARVRRIDATTRAVTTVAGNGIPGFAGDNGPALGARLNCPAGLAFMPGGDLLVADPCANVVRRIAAGADGLVTGAGDEIATTYAGTGIRLSPSSGDNNAATLAALNAPVSLAVDSHGNVLIGENDVQTIRRVGSNGTITTYDSDIASRAMLIDAADNVALADDANGQISCNRNGVVDAGEFPPGGATAWSSLTIDSSGRLYVTEDATAHSVYRVAAVSGGLLCSADSLIQVSLVAGRGAGSVGYSGDGGPSTAATFNHPSGVAADAAGTLFIADTGNNVIRRAQPSDAPSLIITPTSIAFGSQTQLVASAPVTMHVTNPSATSVTLSGLSMTDANAADFAVASDACTGAVLGLGGTCTFDVVFTPQAIGARSATLRVASTAANSPILVGLSGAGILPSPGATVTPTAVGFAPTPIGASSTAVTITLRSAGTLPLLVAGVTLSGSQPGDFRLSADTCSGTSLAPGLSCSVMVAFAPQEACAATAALSFSDNAGGSPQTVLVSGTGIGGATGPYHATLYCTSPGAQPQDMVAAPDGNLWFDEWGSRLSPPAIGRVSTVDGVHENAGAVQSGGWLPFNLTFAPDGSYAYLEGRGPGFPAWLDLVSGSRVQYPLIGNIGVLGLGPDGAFWYAHARACADEPLVTRYAPGTVPSDTAATADWLMANTGGVHCAVPSVVSAGPDGTVWIGLQAGGSIGAPSPSGWVRVAIDGTLVDFTATPGAPTASVASADGYLYTLMTNSPSTCTLERFDAQMARTTIGVDPSVIAIGCAGIAVGPDGHVWVVGSTFTGTAIVMNLVEFDPASNRTTVRPVAEMGFLSVHLEAGADEGIWFNAPPSAVGRFDIGGGPARASVTPRVVGFPPTGVGAASSTRAVTVRSTGTAPLSIASAVLSGADSGQFHLVDGCSGQQLAPGATCTISVSATPTSGGTHAAFLTITDNDTLSVQTVRLAEFTPPPPPTVAPAALVFPSTAVGAVSSPVTVTLTNHANKPLAVVSAAVGGTNATDFSLKTDRCSGVSVPAGGTCTVTIVFAPTATGLRSATVTFIDAANPATQTAAISGRTQSGSGSGGCACSATGLFVDPVVAAPVQTSTSPGGAFTMTVAGPVNAPSGITVKSAAGATVVDFQSPPVASWPVDWTNAYGFSPDGRRFVIHFQSNNEDIIELFNLVGTQPGTPIWTSSIPVPSGGAAQGSLGFSPLGTYLVTAQHQTTPPPIDDTVILQIVSGSGTVVANRVWSPIHVPSEADEDVGSAFWGFAPDDGSFTYVALDNTGIPTLTLVGLPSGAALKSVTFTSSVATYVQFSPCGDVMGLVNQLTDPISVSPPNPVTITLYSTRSAGAPVGAVGSLPAGSLTLAAGVATFTAQIKGWPNTIVVAPNSGAPGCAPASTTGNAGGAPPSSGGSPSSPPADAESLQIDAAPGGPFASTNEHEVETVSTANSSSIAGSAVPPSTTLMLPNGRGTIVLPPGITPTVSTFTYTETGAPSGPVGQLVFGGLAFTLDAVDATTGAPTSRLGDPALATVGFTDADLRSARIHDAATLGLYWWDGTTWVLQSACAGCGVDVLTHTVSAQLGQLGEYMLAADVPPAGLTMATVPIQSTAGTAFAGTLATFIPLHAQDSLSEYGAVITWGDNSVSSAALSAAPTGGIVIAGVHTWAAAGTYPVRITVMSGGFSQAATTTAIVAASPTAPRFTVAAPPLSTPEGAVYAYTFQASGVPTPAFDLTGNPAWLTIDRTTGRVSGTPPSGVSTFAFSVMASNGVGANALAGPFVVTVNPSTSRSADLSVTVGGPAKATKGSTITYTIVVKNSGPATAVNTLVMLGAGPGATLASAAPPFNTGGADFWSWRVASIAPGQSVPVTVRLTVAKAGLVIAVAGAVSETRDPRYENNLAIATTMVK